MSASLAASAKEPVLCCVSFIIIVVGTLGISGGTVRRAGFWPGSFVVPRRDSATGAPRSAERGVPPQHPSDWLSRELHTSRWEQFSLANVLRVDSQ